MHKYTVYQVADMLDTSHTTIYKKINSKEVYKHLQKFITKQGRGTYISLEGVDLLKNYIQPKKTIINSLETSTKNEDSKTSKLIDTSNIEAFINHLETSNKDLIESLNNQVEILQQDKRKLYEQIETKDRQLATKEENTANLTRLLENSQILLKQHQEKILLLETRKEHEEKKKTIWERWFKQ